MKLLKVILATLLLTSLGFTGALADDKVCTSNLPWSHDAEGKLITKSVETPCVVGDVGQFPMQIVGKVNDCIALIAHFDPYTGDIKLVFIVKLYDTSKGETEPTILGYVNPVDGQPYLYSSTGTPTFISPEMLEEYLKTFCPKDSI